MTSQGDHSSERESHILNQCFNLIYNEFKKNAYVPRQTIIKRPNYVDHVFDNYLETLARQFEQKIEHNIQNSNSRKKLGNQLYLGTRARTFNFDVYFDEDTDQGYHAIAQGDEFDEQIYLDFKNTKRYQNNSINLEDNYKPLKEYGEVSKADIEQNLKDLSMVIRKQKF